MPRAPKESKTVSPVPTSGYTEPYLEALGRHKLQALAKRDGIKANMKTRDIIEQLLLNNLKQEETPNMPDPQQEHPDEQEESEGHPSVHPSEPGPSQQAEPVQGQDTHTIMNRHIRALRRQLTVANDAYVERKQILSSVRVNLTYAQDMVNQRSREVEAMMWWNLSAEKRVARRMRQDVRLYDGTAVMNQVTQKVRRTTESANEDGNEGAPSTLPRQGEAEGSGQASSSK